MTDAVSAFRYMAQARHVGKVVLRQPYVDLHITPEGTYLIAGGLGGLGLSCAKWLVGRGARHLVLAGRSAPSPEIERQLEALRATGATVVAARADITRRADVDTLMETIAATGRPLRGVINAAGSLADAMLAHQTEDGFRRVFGPKVDGSWHLHDLTSSI